MKFEYCIQLHFNSFNFTPKFLQNQILVFFSIRAVYWEKTNFYLFVQVSYIFDKVSNNTRIAQIQLCTGMCQKWTFVHAK
jgi:hypothetical protein